MNRCKATYSEKIKKKLEKKLYSISQRRTNTEIRYVPLSTMYRLCHCRKLAQKQANSWLEKAEPIGRRKKLKNEYIYAHPNSSVVKKIPEVQLEWESIPVPSTAIWAVSQPTYLHQNFAPGETKEKCVAYTVKVQEKLKELGNGDKFKRYDTQGSISQDQRLTSRSIKTYKSRNDILMWISKLYSKSTGNVDSSSLRPINAEASFRAQEQSSSKVGHMDINICPYRTCNTKFNVLENSTDNMERAVISARESRIGNLYRFQRHIMGNSCWLPFLFWIMDSFRGFNAYQCQGVINYIIRTPTPKCCRPLCADILRQYYYTFISKEIWGDLRTINTKSSGCSEQINCTNGMDNVRSNIHTVKQAILSSRYRSICISEQHKSTNVLQLVFGFQGSRTRRLKTQLESVGKSILLFTLEPDNTSNQKSTPGENNTINYNPVLEDCNMVPTPTGTIYQSTIASTSNRSNSRPKKRKVTLHEKQALALDGMENQRRALKNQGLGDYAVDFIVCNERRIRRRTRYNSAQQRFLDWKRSKNLAESISAAQIVNYLAEIYFTDKLKPNTIKAYKSAILGLVDNPTEITNQRIFTEFFKTLNESSIRSFIKPSFNISPILETFSNWGTNSEMSIKNLTSKLSWLLAVTGLLRSSNIHRIDDARTYITNGTLHPVIIAPKEKRGEQPVERPCQIAEHSNQIMCPVMAYREYKFRVAITPCITPHINNSSCMVNRLLRQVNRHEKPLSVDSINRYIHSLSGLITRPKDTPIPKARAIGATLAAQAGASADDIVNHAFWSNYSIFDSHYRLSRDLKDNLTESIIPLE
ncbi:hypothetical protein BB561_006376 [Smittium simulii]|uniref:Core-binding (CB) domain-containing protein n=1 Tax=Smittium simulii TaxID=133385 RepID=A0A2T9Y4R3_9FUNG|nr:hypothetical protein BB561_006376 [Smittium simulii]